MFIPNQIMSAILAKRGTLLGVGVGEGWGPLVPGLRCTMAGAGAGASGPKGGSGCPPSRLLAVGAVGLMGALGTLSTVMQSRCGGPAEDDTMAKALRGELLPAGLPAGLRPERRPAPTPKKCADEGYPCKCQGLAFYGHRKTAGSLGWDGSVSPLTADQLRLSGFLEREVEGSIVCGEAGFGGDPALGFVKTCLCLDESLLRDAARRGTWGGFAAEDVRDVGEFMASSASMQKVAELDAVRSWLESTPSTQERAAKLTKLMQEEEWLTCATEGEDCTCTSGCLRYGLRFSGWARYAGWVHRNATPGVRLRCHTANFEYDPSPAELKACECLAPWRAALCQDGEPVDWQRCPDGSKRKELAGPESLEGERYCRAGCDRAGPKAMSPLFDRPRRRDQVCAGGVPHELLWSCSPEFAQASRKPQAGHPHEDRRSASTCNPGENGSRALLFRRVVSLFKCCSGSRLLWGFGGQTPGGERRCRPCWMLAARSSALTTSTA